MLNEVQILFLNSNSVLRYSLFDL